MLKLKLTAFIMATTAILLAVYCIYNEHQFQKTGREQNQNEIALPCSTHQTAPTDSIVFIMPEKN